MFIIKINLFAIAAKLYDALINAGIVFNNHGYPILKSEMLLNEAPGEIIPFEHRNDCKNSKATVLCHFTNDELLYRRLKKVDEDIEICKNFLGATGFDLSPRRGSDITQQKFYITLNQMVNAYRAINGIKILPNFRTGDLPTIESLTAYPAGTLFVVGTLGCGRGLLAQNEMLLKTKILYARPKKLLIYGSLRKQYAKILDENSIPYKIYEDYQKISRRNYKENS